MLWWFEEAAHQQLVGAEPGPATKRWLWLPSGVKIDDSELSMSVAALPVGAAIDCSFPIRLLSQVYCIMLQSKHRWQKCLLGEAQDKSFLQAPEQSSDQVLRKISRVWGQLNFKQEKIQTFLFIRKRTIQQFRLRSCKRSPWTWSH